MANQEPHKNRSIKSVLTFVSSACDTDLNKLITDNSLRVFMVHIRLGVIGLSAKGGWASTDLIPPIFDPLLADKYTLTALCTSSAQSAKDASEKYSKLAGCTVKAYHGKQGQVDIANDPEVDMVVVSVKIPEHYEAVLPAIEAGKMIFVEWSPGKNLDETVRIARAVKEKGLRSMVGAQGINAAYVKKVKEIIDSGKIGKVLSTSLLGSGPYFGKITMPPYNYIYNIQNGLTLLTVPISHFLVVLKHTLGTFVEVNATGAIRIPTAQIIDPANGKPLADSLTNKTTHDQVILSGLLKGRTPNHDGIVANIHYQGGVTVEEPFRWVIYGEEGTVEVKATKDMPGANIATHEKDVYLNDQKIDLGETEADKRLGPTGRAWLEFARGEDGVYESPESSLNIYRVVDAALTSIREGKKVVL
ncbi:hypothetical protein BDY19DRAFT_989267 [Irpex rosettiformis]|uniref:Uncharacterized protein n=1 Tax=Irpex rosettiformis TaxID=378272 RepID=A0ACB8UHN5_9APHY|nr:hypothetical protein BDY19DRAFT_989267 [Irpex rosettiformis]